LLHGEAVAVGIVLAFGLSVERGLCPAEDSQRVSAHLSAAGLPVSLSETGIDTSGAGLVERMKADKKRQGGRLPLILARGIGSAFVDHSVEPAELEAFLDRQS
ncbi:3-dehydroquinate synthase family protein, partial [Allosphingosinicella sp.]|uniref:3-dehydroquinate synthase family protein n=1 Tax=Allosphingosinicella sp. TaxID=2823234 RepID=UPI002F0D7B8C